MRVCALRTAAFIVALAISSGCERSSEPESPPTRRDAIPPDAVKVPPDTDLFPPILHSDTWETPVPLPGPVNTAGVEDSPFITPDGQTLFFFFTPDAGAPPEEQIQDGFTGIWWSRSVQGRWSEPERIVLSDGPSLDGCPFFLNDTLWFCSVRLGNYGTIDVYLAVYGDGRWTEWRNAGAQWNEDFDVGEFHLSADGRTLYFGSSRPGGLGGRDIWVSTRTPEGWSQAADLGPPVNTPADEDQPFLSPDGSELWFTGSSRAGYPGPAVFRSLKQEDGTWGEPEEIVSRFSGEPTLDAEGNLYFVHIYVDETMETIEADIYVAYRAGRTPAATASGSRGSASPQQGPR
jgi:Tol biopolymer transport system component